MENEEYKGFSFCVSCGIISKGLKCNECGEDNFPATDYCEVGHTHCPSCGARFRYKVSRCSRCCHSFTN